MECRDDWQGVIRGSEREDAYSDRIDGVPEQWIFGEKGNNDRRRKDVRAASKEGCSPLCWVMPLYIPTGQDGVHDYSHSANIACTSVLRVEFT